MNKTINNPSAKYDNAFVNLCLADFASETGTQPAVLLYGKYEQHLTETDVRGLAPHLYYSLPNAVEFKLGIEEHHPTPPTPTL